MKPSLAPRIEASEQVQNGGFSAPGRPHDTDVFAGPNFERDAAQRLDHHQAHLVGLADVVKLDDGRGHGWVSGG